MPLESTKHLLCMTCKNVLVILFTVITVAVTVNSTDTDFCDGKRFYNKHSGCVCGQEFARKVKSKDARQRVDDSPAYHINYVNGKKRYYVCRPCTICEDGVRQIAPCWENQDTMCDSKNCEDPNMVYDVGTRSCQPKEDIKENEKEIEGTTETTNVPDDPINDGVHQKVSDDSGYTSGRLRILIVVVCVCSVVIVIVVVVLVVMAIGGMRKCVSKRPSCTQSTANSIEMQSLSGSQDNQSVQSSNV